MRRPDDQVRLAGAAHQEGAIARHAKTDNVRVQPMGHRERAAHGDRAGAIWLAMQTVLLDAVGLGLVDEQLRFGGMRLHLDSMIEVDINALAATLFVQCGPGPEEDGAIWKRDTYLKIWVYRRRFIIE